MDVAGEGKTNVRCVTPKSLASATGGRGCHDLTWEYSRKKVVGGGLGKPLRAGGREKGQELRFWFNSGSTQVDVPVET